MTPTEVEEAVDEDAVTGDRVDSVRLVHNQDIVIAVQNVQAHAARGLQGVYSVDVPGVNNEVVGVVELDFDDVREVEVSVVVRWNRDSRVIISVWVEFIFVTLPSRRQD